MTHVLPSEARDPGVRKTRAQVAALIALLASSLTYAAEGGGAPQRRVAITFDDLPGLYVDNCDAGQYRELNRQLVAAIRRNRMPALGVVNESKLCAAKRDRLKSLLSIWLDAGLDLGNHTFSHPDFNGTSLEDFEKNIVDGEQTLRPLLASRGRTLRYFRFPFLRTGTDLQKKRAIEEFLRKRGYEQAVVTIDNDDYIYAVAYAAALRRGDAALTTRLAGDYIRYMDSIFSFYEKLSRATLGYEPPQILLLHDHQLNADTLDRLSEMIRRHDYTFVSVAEALRDPAYKRTDRYVGARGISWIHRWALDAGKPAPDQPQVSQWVMGLYAAAMRR